MVRGAGARLRLPTHERGVNPNLARGTRTLGEMHVAFFNRSFHPDTAATGQLLTELCEGLTRHHGCRVSVVAGMPLVMTDRPKDARGGGILRRERHDAVEVLRARGTRFSKRRFAGRFSNYVTYFLSACYAGLRLDRPDVIVALTDPPIIGLAAYLASRRFRVPFVMSYRDIFPEVATLLEDFHSDTVNRTLYLVNRFLVKKADRVIAIGETMRRRLVEGKGADPNKTIIIPDWADCEEIVPALKDNPFSRRHGLADKFVVMHSGNLGLAQNLESVVLAAEYLKDLEDLVLVFVGEGVKKPVLERIARERKLPNVRFLPYQPKSDLVHSFAAADCFVVALREGLSGYIVPSKLYGILAAGRPYVAAVERDSEAVAIAERDACGLAAEPANPRSLACAIRMLYNDRALTRGLGDNARKVGLRFDRRVGVRAYDQLFRELTTGQAPSVAETNASVAH
ncbi:MAG: glycosyltransferase family 4 protein [Acidobacteria bacterium]|nr:glycosyltransferase family 4 protein [Acidobacteriota bacterium]